jgi:hypothetical protein
MPQLTPRRLPARIIAIAGIALAIPVLALLIVPIYARRSPELWGFPFFYWYQLLWVFIAAGFTWFAFAVIRSARKDGDE